MCAPIVIDRRFQGPTGSGQGGYTAALTGTGMPARRQAVFHHRIPLDAPLTVHEFGAGGRELRHEGQAVLRVSPSDADIPTPPMVSPSQARDAKAAYPDTARVAVPDCFSCGIRPGSLEVWAGPVGDGTLFATTWYPPDWTADDGTVADPFVWAAIDCPAGSRVGFDGPHPRPALTGTLAAEIVGRVVPGAEHVIVAWADPWKGRRRSAGAALFAADGSLLARQKSLWIAIV